ncbi:uncharacterized protein yc1106_00670 [Curvularia clavata]|uniref:Ribosomal protein bL31m N-terminal domain-containing protein n=1 Tax=Curvularia clavata TaxID=95742 RepID=A0A9Q8Z070_CURCL|nr:uncharacterized protein yc1106_00670 [Curvularia clavata]
MASPIPSMSALRALRQSIQPQIQQKTQVRHATLLRRPKRPYTFTQLITLSDGSAFTVRTTNPQPVYKSAKDIRNSPLWNPSSQKLLNVEEDEAGKLAAFRAKFGRGWDAETEADKGKQTGDHLLDLISRQGKKSAAPPTDATKAPPAKAPASAPAKPAAKK